MVWVPRNQVPLATLELLHPKGRTGKLALESQADPQLVLHMHHASTQSLARVGFARVFIAHLSADVQVLPLFSVDAGRGIPAETEEGFWGDLLFHDAAAFTARALKQQPGARVPCMVLLEKQVSSSHVVERVAWRQEGHSLEHKLHPVSAPPVLVPGCRAGLLCRAVPRTSCCRHRLLMQLRACSGGIQLSSRAASAAAAAQNVPVAGGLNKQTHREADVGLLGCSVPVLLTRHPPSCFMRTPRASAPRPGLAGVTTLGADPSGHLQEQVLVCQI